MKDTVQFKGLIISYVEQSISNYLRVDSYGMFFTYSTDIYKILRYKIRISSILYYLTKILFSVIIFSKALQYQIYILYYVSDSARNRV